MTTIQEFKDSTLKEAYGDVLDRLILIATMHRENGELIEAGSVLNAGLEFLAQPHLEFYILISAYKAKILTELGGVLLWQASLMTGNYDEAIITLEKAVAISKATTDESLVADALDQLGFMHYQRTMNSNQEDYEQALSLFEQALTLRESLLEQQKICVSRFHIGLVAERKHNFEEALAIFTEIKEVAEAHNYPGELAQVHRHIGFAQMRQGKLDQALHSFEQSIAFGQMAGSKAFLPFAHLTVGEVYQEQQRWPEAKSHYQTALQLAQALQIQRAIVQSLYSLGEVEEQSTELELAKQHYEQAYELAKQIDFQLGVAMLQQKLAQF